MALRQDILLVGVGSQPRRLATAGGGGGAPTPSNRGGLQGDTQLTQINETEK